MPSPTRAEALARIDAIDPAGYARTRNALDGAVSGLSPYLTHGVVTMPETVARLRARHPELGWGDKIVFELAWREFWLHVWSHRREAVLADLRGPAPASGRYADTLPEDLRNARTGVPAIDAAVRQLYATGLLHNHARMWLASYAVHLRKLHWRVGADWMFGHLLDGDLPSNHLSWQWVAGTFSSKPYLFNAENVARYAPREGRGDWLSPGTAIDRGYEELERIARSAEDVGPEPGLHAGVPEPALSGAPPEVPKPADAALLRHARTLVTPWSLADAAPGDGPRLGVIHTPAHAALPWSERRWRWVLARVEAVCDGIFVGDLRTLDLAPGAVATAAPLPAVDEALRAVATLRPAPRWLPDPPRPMPSFSAFYAAAQKLAGGF